MAKYAWSTHPDGERRKTAARKLELYRMSLHAIAYRAQTCTSMTM